MIRTRITLSLFTLAFLSVISITLSQVTRSIDTNAINLGLEQAKSYAQRAQTLPVHDGTCQTDTSSTLSSIKDAQMQVSSRDWEAARTKITTALTANTDCLNLLKSDSSPLGRALSYLVTQIGKKLQAVQDRLKEGGSTSAANSGENMETSSTINAEVGSKRVCPASSVDGTKCQFSSCAQGFGLASCSIGFAKGVVGGLNGQTYTVTSDQDSPTNPASGTLRYGTNLARGGAGVWITFARDMVINLQDMLWIQSHTTIDGRGVNVTINKRNLVLGGVKDVIIHNIQVNNIRGSDTIHIFSGTSKVWVDHVTSFAGELGLVSVLQGSTDVTISNCKLQNYNFNMLLGASDADVEDKILRVTVYRNWFMDSMQRMPHCRWGYCHVVNNLYTNWGYYAIGARAGAKVKSESNVFIASRSMEVTPWFQNKPDSFDMSARIESKNDMLLNGTSFHQFLTTSTDATPPYPAGSNPPLASTTSLAPLIQQCSGALFASNLAKCQNAF